MRRLVCALVAAVFGLVLSSCAPRGEERAGSPAAAASRPAPPPVRPGEVLTGEDMERLRQERKELIERPSPLGEEVDVVAAVRRGR